MGDEGGEQRAIPEAVANKPRRMTVDTFFAEGGLKRLAGILGNDSRNTDNKVFFDTNYIEAHTTEKGDWAAHVGRTQLALGKATLSLSSRMLLDEKEKVTIVDPPPMIYDSKGFLLTYVEVSSDGITQHQILTGALNDMDIKTPRERELIEAALEPEKLRAERAKEFMNE